MGVVSFYQGDFAQASAYFEQALDLRRLLGDRRGEGHALYNIGFLAIAEGSYVSARILSEQAVAFFRETGDRWGEADALQCLGAIAANEGDYAAALGYYQQALTIGRDIGHRRCEALLLRSLGHLFADQLQTHEARRYYEMTLPLARELELPGYILECQAGLADLAVAEGNLPLAMTTVVEALNSLNDQALVQANEPFRVYLSCFRALRACQDERAIDLLVTAYRLIQERAAKMPDEASRQAFLQNVPSNRELMHEFEESRTTLADDHG